MPSAPPGGAVRKKGQAGCRSRWLLFRLRLVARLVDKPPQQSRDSRWRDGLAMNWACLNRWMEALATAALEAGSDRWDWE